MNALKWGTPVEAKIWPILRDIWETVPVGYKLILFSNRKSHLWTFYGLSIDTESDDVEWLWTAKYFALFDRRGFWDQITFNWLQLDPYCLQQEWNPNNLFLGDMLLMAIFSNITEKECVKKRSPHSKASIMH